MALVPTDPHLLLLRAQLLELDGRRDEAARDVGRAARLAPRDPRVLNVHAQFLDGQGDRRGAAALLDQVAARHPDEPQAAWKAAVAHALAGDPQRSRALLDTQLERKSVQESPLAVPLLVTRAVTSVAGDPAAAVGDLRLAAGRDVERTLEVTNMLGGSGFVDDLSALADATDRAAPNDPQAGRVAAWVLQRSGQPERSIEIADRLLGLDLDPGRQAALQELAGLGEATRRRPAAAMARFRAALDADPRRLPSLGLLAEVAAEAGSASDREDVRRRIAEVAERTQDPRLLAELEEVARRLGSP